MGGVKVWSGWGRRVSLPAKLGELAVLLVLRCWGTGMYTEKMETLCR